MAYVQITRYTLFYTKSSQRWVVAVQLSGGWIEVLSTTDPEKAHTMINVLRNETPIHYDQICGHLLIGSEPIGEEET